MDRETGVVLEIRGDKAVVLTRKGEFREVPRRGWNWTIGQEVELAEVGAVSSLKRSLRGLVHRPAAWAAALVVLMFCSAFFGYFLGATTPAAYVTVDINPSLELTLNARDQVIDAEGLNGDGEDIVRDLEYRGKPLGEVMELVTELAVQKGFLVSEQKEPAIVISASPVEDESKTPQELAAILLTAQSRVEQALLAHNIMGRVETVHAEPVVREEARAKGLSTGKYVVYLVAREKGLEVELEDFRSQSLGKAIAAARGNLGEILRAAQNQKGFAPLVERYGRGAKAGGQKVREVPGKTGHGPDKKQKVKPGPDREGQSGRLQEPGEDVTAPGAPGGRDGPGKGGKKMPGGDLEGKNENAPGQGRDHPAGGGRQPPGRRGGPLPSTLRQKNSGP